MAALLMATVLFLVGCEQWCSQAPKRLVERMIEEQLQPGAAEQEIVSFFEENGFAYGYHDRGNYYQARPPELERCDGAVITRVYLDEARCFRNSTVEVFYKWP